MGRRTWSDAVRANALIPARGADHCTLLAAGRSQRTSRDVVGYAHAGWAPPKHRSVLVAMLKWAGLLALLMLIGAIAAQGA